MRFVILSLVVMFVTACGGGPIVIRGRIVDQSGIPVRKAEVYTEPKTDFVVSTSRGGFTIQQRLNELDEIEPIQPGVYRIHVSKFGFEKYSFDVKAEGGAVKVPDVILQPRTPDIGEAAPDVSEEVKRGAGDVSIPINGL